MHSTRSLRERLYHVRQSLAPGRRPAREAAGVPAVRAGGLDSRHAGRGRRGGAPALDRRSLPSPGPGRSPGPLRGGRVPEGPRPGNALRRARRRRRRQPGGGGGIGAGRLPGQVLARPGGQRHGRAGRRARAAGQRPCALSAPRQPAAGPCPPPPRHQDRSRRPRAQHLPHHRRRPAHGHLRGIRRRQVGDHVDDRPLHLGRRQRHRPGRRARPRGAGVHPGHPRAGRPRPLGGGGRHLRRVAADAPPI
jgi:hypothetical protein